MTDSRDSLRVFLSSRMAVLPDLRAVLKHELTRQGLDLFVYEADAGARPDSPEQASLVEVERADVVVLVVEHTYGEMTEREYDHARLREKPCLVYLRMGSQPPEPAQEKFLAKLEGARGVPSRDTFTNAVDLAAKVTRDVQAWLMREHRRLTAAVADQSTSPRQSSQFAEDMSRLRAATSAGLQTGGPADLLSWQLRLWFGALDYPLGEEAAVDGNYVEFVVRIPERRRTFLSVLVRVRDSEVQAPDVDAAQARLRTRKQNERLDQCWVVAPQRVSPAARLAAKQGSDVMVFTFDEVIDEDVGFNRYFEWLDGRAKEVKLDEYYVPLAVSVNEVSAEGKSVGRSTYENVGGYVDQWLRDPSSEHLSLLGEFGAGKSWFALHYAVQMARQYREAQANGTPRPRVPLLVRLRDYARGFKDVGALLTDFVFREHKINIQSYAALETLNRLGRLIFIFDGFDEMAARVDRQKMADNFWAMAAVLGPGSKAILTCRTEYFQFAQQARDVFAGKLRGSSMSNATDTSRFQVAELAMFDRVQLEKVLSRKAKPHQVKAVLANDNLVDLARRPVMVDLLIEAMPWLDADRADLAQVYYLAVKRKMERDIGQQRTFTSMKEKVFFMCELSAEMLFTDQMRLHFKAFPERIRQYFGAKAHDVEEDHWHYDLLSQTMLVRDDEGNYRPAHRSLLEFFVAYKLSAEIGALSDEYLGVLRPQGPTESGAKSTVYRWSTFFGGGVSTRDQSIGSFACDTEERLAGSWGRAKVDGTLGSLVYLLCGEVRIRGALASSGTSPASEHYVARLLSILKRYGGLRGVELEGAIIRGAQITGADMTAAKLARTKWVDAVLVQACLDRADLTAARFEKTRLTDTTFRNANLSSVELSEGTEATATFTAAAWGRSAGGEVVVVKAADGRFFVVEPRRCRVVEVEPPSAAVAWQTDVTGEIDCVPFGLVNLGAKPPHIKGIASTPAWRMPMLDESVEMTHESETLATDVEEELVVARLRHTNAELVRGRFVDASSRGGPEDSFMTIAASGRMVAGVRRSGTGHAVVVQKGTEMTLTGFKGGFGASGAFSPDESIVAVSEGSKAIAFWRTDTGDFVARFTVPVVLSGAVVDGATGVASKILRFTASMREGWPLEMPGATSDAPERT